MNVRQLISGSDLRGVALGGSANLTCDVAYRVGEAFTAMLAAEGKKPKITIGRDPRVTGEALESAFGEGACHAGAEVIVFGLCTTPAMFESIQSIPGVDAAVMVTASHLPAERNGLKFFLPQGGIGHDVLNRIVELSESDSNFEHAGGSISHQAFLSTYTEMLKKSLRNRIGSNAEKPLSGLHIVVDAGNGSGGFYATLLSDLGADTTGSQFLEPDGTFPNHIPNPENETAMATIQQAVLNSHADLGVIFDTDCDRAAIVDSAGREINRNRLIALISAILLKEQPGATIVTDSVTSSGLAEFIQSHGGVHDRYRRGYRNVIDRAQLLASQGKCCPLAIETSGHAALAENAYLDDGMYLVTRLIAQAILMKVKGESLSGLIADLREPMESAEVRLAITDKDFRKTGEAVLAHLTETAPAQPGWHVAPDNAEGIRVSCDVCGMKNAGWFLLRLSLHDPVLPINIESDIKGGNTAIARALYEQIASLPGINTEPLKQYFSKEVM